MASKSSILVPANMFTTCLPGTQSMPKSNDNSQKKEPNSETESSQIEESGKSGSQSNPNIVQL